MALSSGVDGFEGRLQRALDRVRLVLDTAKAPVLAAHAQHRYEDKYLLAERMVEIAVASQLNCLASLGPSEELLRQMFAWAKGSAVSLRFRSTETCRYVREEKREEENPTRNVVEGCAGGLRASLTSKVMRTVTAHVWACEASYELLAVRAARAEDVLQVLARAVPSEVRTGQNVAPRPQSKAAIDADVNIGWLLLGTNLPLKVAEPHRRGHALPGVQGGQVPRAVPHAAAEPRRRRRRGALQGLRTVGPRCEPLRRAPRPARARRGAGARGHGRGPLRPHAAAPRGERHGAFRRRAGLGRGALALAGGRRRRRQPPHARGRGRQPLARGRAPRVAGQHPGLGDVRRRLARSRGVAGGDDASLRQRLRAVAGGVGLHRGHAEEPAHRRDRQGGVARGLRAVHAVPRAEGLRPGVHARAVLLRRPPLRPPHARGHREHRRGGGWRGRRLQHRHAYHDVGRPGHVGAPHALQPQRLGSGRVRGRPVPPRLVVAQVLRPDGREALAGGAGAAVQLHARPCRPHHLRGHLRPQARHARAEQGRAQHPAGVVHHPHAEGVQGRHPLALAGAAGVREGVPILQLESTLFGILVIHVKPQLERVLNLPQDSLTKEIKLTQDIMQLFIKYHISSDLLSYEEITDFADVALEADRRLAAVRGHVAAMQAMVDEAKREEVEERRRQAEYEMTQRRQREEGEMMQRLQREEEERARLERRRRCEQMKMITYGCDTPPARSSGFGGGFFKAAGAAISDALRPSSSNQSGARRSMKCAMDAAVPISEALPSAAAPPPPPQAAAAAAAAPPQTSACQDKPPSEPQVQAPQQTSQGRDGEQQSPPQPTPRPTPAAAGAVSLDRDLSKVPSQMDAEFERLDADSALRPTIINPGEVWTRRAQKALLAKPSTETLGSEEQKRERDGAFDLLDALTPCPWSRPRCTSSSPPRIASTRR